MVARVVRVVAKVGARVVIPVVIRVLFWARKSFGGNSILWLWPLLFWPMLVLVSWCRCPPMAGSMTLVVGVVNVAGAKLLAVTVTGTV